MEKRASHQRQQARHNGTLGRRVDPNNLSRAECKVLIEAICQRSQEKGKNILTEMAGLQRPTVEVRFENISVTARVLVGQRGQDTVLNYYGKCIAAGLAQVGLTREKRERLQILDGVSGVLQPGRMTLLLGPPSSGKSTLLKALAGLLTPDRNLKVRGAVTYNDRELDQFVVHRTAAFMDQQDNHIPCLTVRETLNFSARCQGSGQRPDEMSAIRQIEKGQHCVVDNLLNIFMKGCAAENRDEHLIAGFMKI
ncbi:g355 [Coccomyxa viridis]|uniref:G355 protein n=1 Tax=Coccomyxa viridis TaxID=1274662 RepID=A0ABP1FM50_9CHLO